MNNQTNPKYRSNHNHRNNNPKKSQWTLNKNDEIILFKKTYGYQWIYSNNKNKPIGFGIEKNNNNQIKLLGHSAKMYGQIRELKIAKFVENQNNWHGYPADYHTHKADTPPEEILKKWVFGGFIDKKIMCKILKGQKCNL